MQNRIKAKLQKDKNILQNSKIWMHEISICIIEKCPSFLCRFLMKTFKQKVLKTVQFYLYSAKLQEQLPQGTLIL